MPQIANTCGCAAHLEFVRNECARSGRQLEVRLGKSVHVDGWARLEAAVSREQLALRAEAVEAGVAIAATEQEWPLPAPVCEDPGHYAAWLAEQEAERVAEDARLAARRAARARQAEGVPA